MADTLALELQQLFKTSFLINCEIEDAHVSEDDLKTIDSLSFQETLDNFRELVGELLTFKKNFKLEDKAEMADRATKFEEMLQKLENDVRNHISIEHQLRIHLETAQGKVEELESQRKLTGRNGESLERLQIQHSEQLRAQETYWTKLLQAADQEKKQVQKQLESARDEVDRLKKSLDLLTRKRNDKVVMYGIRQAEIRTNKFKAHKHSETKLPIKITKLKFLSQKPESQSFHLFNRSIDDLKPTYKPSRNSMKSSKVTRAPSR